MIGGSSGIGNGVAHAFRDHGAKVFVWGTRPAAADYAAEEGSNLAGLTYEYVDVSDRDRVDAHTPGFATLDVLVQCQGTVVYKRGEFEREGWDKVMAVNLDSLLACGMKLKPLLAATEGSMIIVSSISGLNSNFGNPAYAASKAGAINLTKSLGEAWATDGIRVNGIAPGLVDTKLTKVTTQHPQRREKALAAIPLGRMATPHDMAGPVLFLASPLAQYLCGQTIIADGGLTLS